MSLHRQRVPKAHGQAVEQAKPALVTLVLGGVRSGKSRYAQHLAERVEHVTFVATAERSEDAEMTAKIERHRADRPQHWVTMEEPLELVKVIHTAAQSSEVIVIDCLTLFAAKLLEVCGEDAAELHKRIEELCGALRAAPCRIFLVSNEVGSGVVPAYELGRRFRDLVGELNQRVAAAADTVILMVAGLPFPLKGSLAPEVHP